MTDVTASCFSSARTEQFCLQLCTSHLCWPKNTAKKQKTTTWKACTAQTPVLVQWSSLSLLTVVRGGVGEGVGVGPQHQLKCYKLPMELQNPVQPGCLEQRRQTTTPQGYHWLLCVVLVGGGGWGRNKSTATMSQILIWPWGGGGEVGAATDTTLMLQVPAWCWSRKQHLNSVTHPGPELVGNNERSAPETDPAAWACVAQHWTVAAQCPSWRVGHHGEARLLGFNLQWSLVGLLLIIETSRVQQVTGHL